VSLLSANCRVNGVNREVNQFPSSSSISEPTFCPRYCCLRFPFGCSFTAPAKAMPLPGWRPARYLT